jgi:hypothetical protein
VWPEQGAAFGFRQVHGTQSIDTGVRATDPRSQQRCLVQHRDVVVEHGNLGAQGRKAIAPVTGQGLLCNHALALDLASSRRAMACARAFSLVSGDPALAERLPHGLHCIRRRHAPGDFAAGGSCSNWPFCVAFPLPFTCASIHRDRSFELQAWGVESGGLKLSRGLGAGAPMAQPVGSRELWT